MTPEQWAIAAMLPITGYGIVQVVGRIDRRIEKIRGSAYKLATICENANLMFLHAFFIAIATGDKSGVITAARQILKELAPDKLWETLREAFFKSMTYRLEHFPEDELRMVREIDEHRVKKDALLRNTLVINDANAARRTAEPTSAITIVPLPSPVEPPPVAPSTPEHAAGLIA